MNYDPTTIFHKGLFYLKNSKCQSIQTLCVVRCRRDPRHTACNRTIYPTYQELLPETNRVEKGFNKLVPSRKNGNYGPCRVIELPVSITLRKDPFPSDSSLPGGRVPQGSPETVLPPRPTPPRRPSGQEHTTTEPRTDRVKTSRRRTVPTQCYRSSGRTEPIKGSLRFV